MLEFNLPRKRPLLTVENVLSRVNELEIFRHFIGKEFIVGKTLLSPLRQESRPSFGVYPTPHAKYKFHFKDYNGAFGNVFTLVCELHKREFSLLFALYVINKEMNLNLNDLIIVQTLKREGNNVISSDSTSAKIVKYSEYISFASIKAEVEFRIKTREPQKYDEIFWWDGKISYKTLLFYNVHFTQEVWYRKNQELWMKIWVNSPSNQIYSYYFPDSFHFKHYRPLEKENIYGDKWKWLSNCNVNDVQGYSQLPKRGNVLIITKSLKDVMTLYELGFNAISFNAEGVNIPLEIFHQLQERFTEIICYYDNDETGKKNSYKITKEYGLQNIRHFNNPDHLKEKDAFDYVKSYGQKVFLGQLALKNIYPDYQKLII